MATVWRPFRSVNCRIPIWVRLVLSGPTGPTGPTGPQLGVSCRGAPVGLWPRDVLGVRMSPGQGTLTAAAAGIRLNPCTDWGVVPEREKTSGDRIRGPQVAAAGAGRRVVLRGAGAGRGARHHRRRADATRQSPGLRGRVAGRYRRWSAAAMRSVSVAGGTAC